jgi:hypothetical protein
MTQSAPSVTEDRINEVIASVDYFKLTDTLTVCVLKLVNGFSVTGESACVSPENFNEQTGRDYAFANAREKIWALEGYLLKQWLHLEAAAAAAEDEEAKAPRIVLVNP